MEKGSFVIRFDIWLVKSNRVLTMQAVVQPGKTDSSYLVHSFSNTLINHHEQNMNGKLTLPYMPVQRIERDGKKIWVHAGSEKETNVSTAIGRAIDAHDHILYANQFHPGWKQEKTGS